VNGQIPRALKGGAPNPCDIDRDVLSRADVELRRDHRKKKEALSAKRILHWPECSAELGVPSRKKVYSGEQVTIVSRLIVEPGAEPVDLLISHAKGDQKVVLDQSTNQTAEGCL